LANLATTTTPIIGVRAGKKRRPGPRDATHLAMLAPVLVFVLVIALAPLAFSFLISLTDYRLTDPAQARPFVGLGNYVKAFQDKAVTDTLINTIVFVAGAVISQVALGLALAMLMSAETRFMRTLRSLVILPLALPPLIVGLIWRAVFNVQIGPIPFYLKQLGFDVGRGPLGELNTAMLAVLFIDMWQWTPLLMIIFLAGIKSLPGEIHEAAHVDGASRWQTFTRITLPLLMPVLFIGVLLRTMNAFKIFDIIFVATGGGPGNATSVLNFHIYKVGLTFFDMGYAAALANILLFMIGICSAIYILLLQRQRVKSGDA
jgi:multiple sugar transport system permease protein